MGATIMGATIAFIWGLVMGAFTALAMSLVILFKSSDEIFRN